MKTVLKLVLALIVGLSATHLQAVAAEIFSDGFESGDKSATKNGFRWTDAGRNVYVVKDPVTGIATKPYQGKYSLAFTHRAKPIGEDSSAEQRFDLGGSYPEIWFSYWVRVPDNFYHRSGGGAANTKWLALWTNNYEDRTGVTAVWEYWPSSDGSSRIAYRWVGPDGASAHQDYTAFIDATADRGKWMHVVHRVKVASSNGSDGIFQMWVKKQGSNTYKQIHNRTNAPIRPAGGGAGFRAGYLMGWSNSGFNEDTSFYIDNFKVSTTSLLEDSGPAPNPPTNLQVE